MLIVVHMYTATFNMLQKIIQKTAQKDSWYVKPKTRFKVSKKVSSLLFQCDMRTLLQDTYKYRIHTYKIHVRECPGPAPFSPQNSPFTCGIWTPVNEWFLGPTRVHIPNGISIGSAVLAGLTVVTDRQTDRPRYSVCINRPHLASRPTAMRHDNIKRPSTNFTLSLLSLYDD